MKTCIHKWVDMEDGTLDKFCVRCSHKAKQAVASFPHPEVNVEITLSTKSYLQPLSPFADYVPNKVIISGEAITEIHRLAQIGRNRS